jgi:hypothetical protein
MPKPDLGSQHHLYLQLDLWTDIFSPPIKEYLTNVLKRLLGVDDLKYQISTTLFLTLWHLCSHTSSFPHRSTPSPKTSTMSTNIYEEDVDFAALALQDADFAKV